MNMNKAPRGGLVSNVNGNEYKGGQFMPEHGMYCGTGKARITASEKKLIDAKLEMTGKRIEWNEAQGCWKVIAIVTFSGGFTGEQVLFSIYSKKSLLKLVG